MRFHETLEDVLGSRVKIRILRLFYRTQGSYTGREIAKLIDYSQEATRRALNDLAKQGLLMRDYAGNSYIYHVNEEHIFIDKAVNNAFFVEQNSLLKIAMIFKEQLGKDFDKVVIFGSIAKKEERPDSDIDILVIVRDSTEIDAIEDRINKATNLATTASGNPVMPIVMRVGEYEKKGKLKNKQGIWREIFDRNKTITYTRKEIELYGQKDQQKTR